MTSLLPESGASPMRGITKGQGGNFNENQLFVPVAWLEKIDPRFIVQCHVVGYGCAWHDSHTAAIQEDLWELIEAVTSYAPCARSSSSAMAISRPTRRLLLSSEGSGES